jgi:hypothetical protein
MRTVVQCVAGMCVLIASTDWVEARAAGTADSVVKVFSRPLMNDSPGR